LAQLHEGGRGVPADHKVALALYRQALAAGQTDAAAAVRRIEAELAKSEVAA
jgi:TPR repeat protein